MDPVHHHEEMVYISIELVGGAADGQTSVATTATPTTSSSSTDCSSSNNVDCSKSNNSSHHASSSASGRSPLVTVERFDQATDDGDEVRLVVSLPADDVDSDAADFAASLLMDHIDQLQNRAVVDSIKISDVKFTPEGLEGLIMFLTMYIPTVKHLSLNNLISAKARSSRGKIDETTMGTLAHAFQSTSLETLNLSRNMLGPYVWRQWMTHSGLKCLILDYVEMDDASFVELNSFLACKDTLEDLHVVLMQPIGVEGLDAANDILKSCTKLKYLRWVYKHGTKSAALPWIGLRQMVEKQQSTAETTSEGARLVSLRMEGARMTERDLGERGLCGALKYLSKLQNLKLRNLGLIDNAVQKIVETLISETLPDLVMLDFSFNSIRSKGVKALAKLVNCPNIIRSLRCLSLIQNKVDNDGFSMLLDTFGTHGHPDLDIRLEGNPFDAGRLVFGYAMSKRQATQERDILRDELDKIKHDLDDARHRLRHTTSGQATVLADYNVLQREKAKAVEERDSLLQAFSIMGMSRRIEENRRLLDRVNALEEMVFSSMPSRDATGNTDSNVKSESLNRVEELIMERTKILSGETPTMINRRNSNSMDTATQDTCSTFASPRRTCSSWSSSTASETMQGSSSMFSMSMHSRSMGSSCHENGSMPYNNLLSTSLSNDSNSGHHYSYSNERNDNRSVCMTPSSRRSGLLRTSSEMMITSPPSRVSPRIGGGMNQSPMSEKVLAMHNSGSSSSSSVRTKSLLPPRRSSCRSQDESPLETYREDPASDRTGR